MTSMTKWTCAAVLAALAACSSSTTDNFTNPPPGPPATCAQIASLPGCDNGSLSFACGSADRPDGTYVDPDTGVTQIDTNLVCSNGTPGAGSSTLYCCAPFAQSDTDCVPDEAIADCGGTAMGFACTADGVMPTDADPTIACSAAVTGGSDAPRYCCNTAAIPPTCAADTGVTCTGGAVGYACLTGASPLDAGAPLTCIGAAAPGSGNTGFCCTL